MPRQSVKPKNTRQQWTDQDTFDYSTPNLNVTARPTDPYVRPAMSNDAAAVAQFAQTLQKGLGLWEKQKAVKHEEDIEAGKRAYTRGEEKPEDASKGFIKGYELLEGVAGGADLDNLLKDHYEKNWQATPQEFADSQNQLIQQFMVGRSDNYVDGILNMALEVEKNYTRKHYEANRELIKGNIENHIRKTAEGMVSIMLDQGIDPKRLREGLSGVQALAKEQGLSRPEVSKLFAQTVGLRAIAEGKPELMMFAYESEGGISLMQTDLAPDILRFIKQAEAERDSRNASEQKAVELNKEELTKSVERTLSEMIYTLKPNDHKGWAEATKILLDASNPERNEFKVALDAKTIEHYHKHIQALRHGGNFATETDMDVWIEAYTSAKEGTLTPEKLNMYEHRMARDDYKEIAKIAANRTEHGVDNTAFMKNYNEQFSMAEKIVDKTDPMGSFFDRYGKDRAAYVNYLKHVYLEDYKNRNNGKLPDMHEVYELSIEATKAAFNRFKPDYDMSDFTGNSSGGGKSVTETVAPDDPWIQALERMIKQ